jgi:hypothetical protein
MATSTKSIGNRQYEWLDLISSIGCIILTPVKNYPTAGFSALPGVL